MYVWGWGGGAGCLEGGGSTCGWKKRNESYQCKQKKPNSRAAHCYRNHPALPNWSNMHIHKGHNEMDYFADNIENQENIWFSD